MAKTYAGKKDLSKEELYIYIQINSHLNGWHGDKRREPSRLLMAKRRKLGLTQKANREYAERNKLACQLYAQLMAIEPKLVRKGKHSFGRGVK